MGVAGRGVMRSAGGVAEGGVAGGGGVVGTRRVGGERGGGYRGRGLPPWNKGVVLVSKQGQHNTVHNIQEQQIKIPYF